MNGKMKQLEKDDTLTRIVFLQTEQPFRDLSIIKVVPPGLNLSIHSFFVLNF